MMKTSLAGTSNIPCSLMRKDKKNSRSGNWGSVHIGLVNGDFQLWEERGKHTKVRVP